MVRPIQHDPIPPRPARRPARTLTAAALTGALAAGLAACGLGGAAEPPPAGAPVAGGGTGTSPECPAVAAPGDSRERELRAMWIATVGNIDWPDKGDDAEQQKAHYRRLLDRARDLNLNSVFVQIRPNSDAFYDSPYEPWSKWITGTPGKNPGYDVLDFMIKESHARNLEFHAWFNPYRVARETDRSKLAPDSPARKNPSWVREYGGGLWYDPGLPEVRDLATKAVLDVVRKYDIDAVHFDDYFYPYPDGSGDYPDEATYRRFGDGKTKAAWRRGNVDTLVRDLHGQIRRAKPHVRFGISPFGVWRNKSSDPAGSDTRALQSYDAQYADTRRWIKEGWIDYVTPQLYWAIGDSRADYGTLVAWWSKLVQGTGVQLTIGQAAYRGGESGPWKNPAELSKHLTLNQRHPQVRGDVYFSAKDMVGNRAGLAQRVRKDHYGRPALPPPAPGGKAPAAVRSVTAAADGDRGVRVGWQPSRDATAYAVYRVDGKGAACAAVPADRLLTSVRGGGIVDPTAKAGQTYTYYVTALDRLHHESAPARAATVTAPGR
ncbi:glycoside hydrolase family 10 protein [Actinomadura flavalba]|uniref:glycoside hydrolase family 10 protein n=1 Tax=Actinomadura flavalba TaxID=1120938 RepID=UPI00035DE1FF|nr:family 10 glycosylhydrolase [Actinomadura flavalba]